MSKANTLSKFLTNSQQPKIEANSGIAKPPDLDLPAVNAAQFLDMVKATSDRDGAKSARPSKQQALQQSVLHN